MQHHQQEEKTATQHGLNPAIIFREPKQQTKKNNKQVFCNSTMTSTFSKRKRSRSASKDYADIVGLESPAKRQRKQHYQEDDDVDDFDDFEEEEPQQEEEEEQEDDGEEYQENNNNLEDEPMEEQIEEQNSKPTINDILKVIANDEHKTATIDLETKDALEGLSFLRFGQEIREETEQMEKATSTAPKTPIVAKPLPVPQDVKKVVVKREKKQQQQQQDAKPKPPASPRKTKTTTKEEVAAAATPTNNSTLFTCPTCKSKWIRDRLIDRDSCPKCQKNIVVTEVTIPSPANVLATALAPKLPKHLRENGRKWESKMLPNAMCTKQHTFPVSGLKAGQTLCPVAGCDEPVLYQCAKCEQRLSFLAIVEAAHTCPKPKKTIVPETNFTFYASPTALAPSPMPRVIIKPLVPPSQAPASAAPTVQPHVTTTTPTTPPKMTTPTTTESPNLNCEEDVSMKDSNLLPLAPILASLPPLPPTHTTPIPTTKPPKASKKDREKEKEAKNPNRGVRLKVIQSRSSVPEMLRLDLSDDGKNGTCAQCKNVFEIDKLFDPACPICYDTYSNRIYCKTKGLFKSMCHCANPDNDHWMHVSCLRRNRNLNRRCPVVSCQRIIQYGCEECHKEYAYQAFTKQGHSCYIAHRRGKPADGDEHADDNVPELKIAAAGAAVVPAKGTKTKKKPDTPTTSSAAPTPIPTNTAPIPSLLLPAHSPLLPMPMSIPMPVITNLVPPPTMVPTATTSAATPPIVILPPPPSIIIGNTNTTTVHNDATVEPAPTIPATVTNLPAAASEKQAVPASSLRCDEEDLSQ